MMAEDQADAGPAEVIPVPGLAAVTDFHAPDPEIVEACERLLQWAKEGEIVSLAYVSVRRGSVVGTGWTLGASGSMHNLNSGASMLSHRIAVDLTAEAEW